MSGSPGDEDQSAPPTPLAPVARAGLTEQVIDRLRERIVDGTWRLHQRIPVEPKLAQELGVGRSTIREAIRVLAYTGLLEARQGSGTYVRARHEIDAALGSRVQGADVFEGFELRRALEVEIARLAAIHRSPDDITRLRKLADDRDRADIDQSTTGYRDADQALTEQLLIATGNALLAELYRGVVHPLQRALPANVTDAELTRDDPDHPETPELLDAIERGDTDRAAAAAARRIDNAARVLQALLSAVIPPRR